MTSIVTQADWTPADEGMLQQLRNTARAMVISVAKTGSSHFNTEVLTFQKQWNVSKPTIIKALALVQGWTIAQASPHFVALKEDGGYGLHTAGALSLLVTPGPKPPATASNMTLYYANNASFIDSLVPPQTTVIPPVVQSPGVSSQATVIQPQTNNAQIQAAASYVPAVAKQASGSISTSNVVVSKKTTTKGASKVRSPLPAATVPESKAQVLDFTQDPSPTTVVATPVGTDYRLLAIGVGGLALGGVFFMMLRNRKRAA